MDGPPPIRCLLGWSYDQPFYQYGIIANSFNNFVANIYLYALDI